MNVSDQAQESTRAERKVATEFSGRRPVVLSIAGFDPSSGAGITADLKVFSAQGFYAMACITALTVQSTLGVRAVEPVAAATVEATLKMLAEDVSFSGIKLGMLATNTVCAAVADFLDSAPGVPVVLDPVLRSSSGLELLDSKGIEVLRQRLLAKVDWITPNLDELSLLTGLSVGGAEQVPAAAKRLLALAREAGNKRLNIVVTGGHLETPADFLLTSAGESAWIPGVRVETNATHGTGCAFASALLCRLVLGDPPEVAAFEAKKYVTTALRAAYPVGRGEGPMNHFFRFDESAER